MLNAPAYICMEFSVISDLEFKKKKSYYQADKKQTV